MATDRAEPMGSLLLGIDPGKRTGLAFYDAEDGTLTRCEALDFWEAVEAVRSASDTIAGAVVEDARRVGLYAHRDDLRGRRRDAAARSVGEIDAQVRLWLELFERLGIPAATEQPTRQKWDAETFAALTGWEGRTNEPARDAARLVFGRSAKQFTLTTP